MQNIFELQKEDLSEIFTQTAFKLGMGLPSIVEKDFWVVKLLQLLFVEKDFLKHHVFKGGTSLSKCFGLIQRFSEDVDITISKKFLGFDESVEDVSEMGSKQRKRYFDALLRGAENHVHKISRMLFEKLQSQCHYSDWRIYIDSEDQQKIIFEYPKALALSMYPEDSYVKPKIVLEFGCRGELEPSTFVNVMTYAEEAFSHIFSKSDIVVNALSLERTFWEKITLLHMLAHQDDEKPLQSRMARHYYDVYMLSKSGVGKGTQKQRFALLASVARHKAVYFRSKQASYQTAKPGSLKLLPSQRRLKLVESDYQAMTEMFFGNAVSFSEILSEITMLENALNNK